MFRETLLCPNPGCPNYAQPGQDVIVKSLAKGRVQCKRCQMTFTFRHGTALLHLHANETLVCRALKALAEGLSLRATARVFDLDKDTVCHWLEVASAHGQAVTRSLCRGLQMSTGRVVGVCAQERAKSYTV